MEERVNLEGSKMVQEGLTDTRTQRYVLNSPKLDTNPRYTQTRLGSGKWTLPCRLIGVRRTNRM